MIFLCVCSSDGVVSVEVCGCFLPSREHDPLRLCVPCRGKSCKSDNCCEEFQDWPDDRCNRVSDDVEKLSLR